MPVIEHLALECSAFLEKVQLGFHRLEVEGCAINFVLVD